MNKKTLVILVVVIVVLNLAAITTGLVTNSDNQQAEPVPAVLGALGGLLGGLAPNLPLNGLRCNNQPVADPFVLEARRDRKVECAIAIPADAKEKYRRTELQVLSPMEGVFLRVDYRFDQRPRVDQDPECLQESKLNQRLARRGLFLEIHYEPRQESSADGTCWLMLDQADPLALTVLADGATLSLSLTCERCEQATGRFQLR